MSAQPWMKFYPRDWRGDQALRAVSGFARGLWMECICIMHEAEPYGHLVLNGHPIEPAVLAQMTSLPLTDVQIALAELTKCGVLSRTRSGVIFSRRMKCDRNRAENGRKAVLRRYAKPTENIEEKDAPTRSPSRLPSRIPTTQKPEARESKKESSPLTPTDPGTVSAVVGTAAGETKINPSPLSEPSRSEAAPVKPPDTRPPDSAVLPPGWSAGTEFLPPMPPEGAAGLSDQALMGSVWPSRETGEGCVNGISLNFTAERVTDAARIDTARWRGDYRPIIRWLLDDFSCEHIVAAITEAAKRQTYRPPFSLAYFDRVVREYQPRDRRFG